MSDYFIHSASGQQGPYKLDELKAAGITKDSKVWREGLAAWVKAGELEELNSLFAVTPPPYVEEKIESTVIPPPFIEEEKVPVVTPPPIPAEKTVSTTASVPKGGSGSMPKENKSRLIIISLVVLAVAVAAFFYFRSDDKDNEQGDEKVKLAGSDSTVKRDTAKTDSIKKFNPDTLSNWMVTDSSLIKQTDTGSSQSTEFIIPGMPTKEKNKEKKETAKQTTKEKVKETTKETTKPQKQKNTEPAPNETEKTVPVKPLVVHGGFHKNLLLEAVLEGSIRNVNKNVSFRNVVITVNFLDDNGNSLGSNQFSLPGVLYGGDVSSFKFKARAPKGSKSARYAASGSVF